MRHPSLSVRAFAELMRLPAYEQTRILYDQKYPKSSPGAFKVPYYKPALGAIRTYYTKGNDLAVLREAILDIQSGSNEPRARNNERVVKAFRRSNQASRRLEVQSMPRVSDILEGVELRLSPDLSAVEGSHHVRVFYNFRSAPLDQDVARVVVELAHHVLGKHTVCKLSEFELIDFAAGAVHCHRRPRKRTLMQATETAKVIQALWPTI